MWAPVHPRRGGTVAELEAAGRDTSQYVIGTGKRNKYTAIVDGEAIPQQYAIYANHRPRGQTNAKLTWDHDRYHGRATAGQPVLMLTKPVDQDQEITVDYGPWFTQS
jgi:hypothetical protein